MPLIGSRPQLWLTTGFQTAAQGLHSPLHNQLLASLPAADFDRLRPLMKSVNLPCGTPIHGAGEKQDETYFPTTGIIVRRLDTMSGATVALALTGFEGAVGITSTLGGGSMSSGTLALTDVHAYQIGANALRRELERGGPLARVLFRYVQIAIAQIAQNVACNRFHPVEQQLCRLLLSCLDRSASNVLVMTQEMIGSLLGVRRESVTAAARNLQTAGALACRWGRITIHNRALLEAEACECYEIVRREQARMFAETKASRAPVPAWIECHLHSDGECGNGVGDGYLI